MRVLVIDTIAPEGIAFLRAHGCEVDQLAKPPHEELLARVGACEGLVTRSSTAVTSELLSRAARLRIVGRAGVGVDNIDVEACSRRGILVVNAPYGNVVSAAEHTLGMLLALVRRIPLANDRLKRLAWDRGISGSELSRKTAGVIGLGKVGSRVATRLLAFEMEVIAYDPYIPERRAEDLGVRLTDLETLLRTSDIVTLHVPLTDETANMIAARELHLMKPGVRLINCARGGIVNETDLLNALESGHVAGAAVDVWSEEPPRSRAPKALIEHPHVVVTPHLGANTDEAQVNVAVDVARQIVAFRDGELPEFAVNIPGVEPTNLVVERPFLALAERMGRFSIQLDPEHLERVEVVVSGQLARRDPELLTRAVLAGLLDRITSEVVNARIVAAQRGLEVSVGADQAGGGYTNLLTVTTHTRQGRKTIAGTVFDGVPRVVRLRDLHIEFVPEGYVLVLSYEDRPGMVGRIGTVLGRHRVNIAAMHVGRREKHGRAIVVLLLDENLAPPLVDEVARAVDADFARMVRL